MNLFTLGWLGVVASAEYRSWEEAAMAGVSLVADAAEQLERAANERNGFSDGGTCNMLSKEMYNSNNGMVFNWTEL